GYLDEQRSRQTNETRRVGGSGRTGEKELVQDGKDAVREGDLHKALQFFKSAHNIQQSQKLESRIKKIEDFIAQDDLKDEDEEYVNVKNCGLMLFKDLHDKLYDYQRHGVAFLYSLYRDGRKGGILADDMGLGKTIQVISFLSGMYDNELVKHILLIMPTSLLTNWTKEFAKWTPGIRVKGFHGASKAERTRNLEKVQRRGGVIITTYNMLLNNWQQLSSYHNREFVWDYMVLDEAHKIKSSATKTAKSAYAIPSKNRVLLTGTPVQNNLREMWALFDFACQGTLLGTAKTFKAEYENPITRAREKDATPGEKALGSRMSETLMAIIKPYFLRRTKTEIQKEKTNGAHPTKEENSDNKENQVPHHQKDSGAVTPKLTRKNDLIVWTYLSSVQEEIYRQFISLDHIKELLMTSRSPLAELNILKKVCDHPRLLSAGAIAKLGLEESAAKRQQNEDMETDTHSIANVPDNILISESGKLVFLFALLERLRLEGHRTLVFAHYRKMLDIIERILGNRGFKVLRLDGTVTQIAERERRISLFQNDKRYSVFLLTTQVGGVGITLTAANRVVIYDPSWSPATDAQAVDRAYRIGQTDNVIIYRLITCGTVEEKIYRRQVFKDSLIRQNTGDKKNPFRYFSKQELKELFTLEDSRSSSTQLQLQALHSRHRRTDRQLDEHIAHLHAMEMFGISDHDLMFSLDINHDETVEDQEEHRYIEGRVQKAQELMKAESDLQMQLAASMASSTEPAWLRPPGDNSNREGSEEKKPRNPRQSPSHPQLDSNFSTSAVAVEMGEGSPANITAPDEHEQQISGNSHSKCYDSKMDLTQVSAGVESFEGNFNLQLEDSDIFPDHDIQDHQETEAEERKLLSQLRMEGSFDINKSLSERQHEEALRQSLTNGQASEIAESMNDSIVVVKKKRASVIYDSEDDDVGGKQQLDTSSHMLGTSTPKSVPSTPLRSRKSIGGNVSVASRRSLLQLIIKDLGNHNEDMVDEDEGDEDGDISEMHSDEAEKVDISSSTHSELQLDETNKEILNTESMDEVEEEECEEAEEEEGEEEVEEEGGKEEIEEVGEEEVKEEKGKDEVEEEECEEEVEEEEGKEVIEEGGKEEVEEEEGKEEVEEEEGEEEGKEAVEEEGKEEIEEGGEEEVKEGKGKDEVEEEYEEEVEEEEGKEEVEEEEGEEEVEEDEGKDEIEEEGKEEVEEKEGEEEVEEEEECEEEVEEEEGEEEQKEEEITFNFSSSVRSELQLEGTHGETLNTGRGGGRRKGGRVGCRRRGGRVGARSRGGRVGVRIRGGRVGVRRRGWQGGGRRGGTERGEDYVYF
uniref:DNA excision repair protein ERCC-6-like n=1 Tax=Monopterus albus TaxID=43700 RepID=A0A3Q3IJL0_MONAL